MESGRLAGQAQKAVSALIKHESLALMKEKKRSKASSDESKESKQRPLLDDPTDGETLASNTGRIHLIISLNRISEKTSLKPIRLPIPHPFRDATDEGISVCVITKDPQRFYKDLINPLQLKAIAKIVGVSKLRAKFKPYEARRRLCASFDLFIADTRILPMLPKLLGKTFFDKKKQPLPVDLTKTTPQAVTQELKGAIEATVMFHPSGSNTSICVGKISQSAAEVASNIEAVLRQLGKRLPGGLTSIQTIHVKTHDSVALPIYVRDAPTASDAKEDSN